MKRSVALVGFAGVQALDLVGPFEVFTGANVYLAGQGRADDGYLVSIASADGRSVSTGTGLEIVAHPLPDPTRPIDAVVLPGGKPPCSCGTRRFGLSAVANARFRRAE